MGFFSSIGGLFGGSKSTSSSGFGALPQVAQNAFTNSTTQASNLLLGQNGQQLFTPLPQTAAETQAYGLAQQPTTQAGVTGLTNNYLNPFTNFLTDNINQQAAGNWSAYKSAMSDSGQIGSNREFLNAGAADQARLSAIGTTLANSYQGSQNTALNQNQQNINNLLGQGQQERGLAMQTSQAPLSALQALVQLLQGYPSTQTQTSKNYGNGLIGNIASGVSAGLSGAGG